MVETRSRGGREPLSCDSKDYATGVEGGPFKLRLATYAGTRIGLAPATKVLLALTHVPRATPPRDARAT